MSVVTHPKNFADSSDFFYDWLNFVAAQQNANTGISKTATETVQLSSCYSALDVHETIPFANDISIYLNPASNQINITSGSKIFRIYIYDHMGNLVLASHNQNQTILLPDNFTTGMYIVRVQTDHGDSIHKLILDKYSH